MMLKSVSLHEAITRSLAKSSQSVITDYQLEVLICLFYRKKEYDGQPLRVRKDMPELSDYNRTIDKLINSGVIKSHIHFPRKIFTVFDREISDNRIIICNIDPFCYISHLSAMEYQGLTYRIPKMIFITSPGMKLWKSLASERVKKDLGEDIDVHNLPFRLQKIPIKKIGKTNINCYSPKSLGSFKKVGENMRVATIGRTFFDMLQNPDLCGGTHHIVEVFEEYSEKYSELIINEVDRHGKPIDKVRAGYILEEICNIKSPVLESWLKYVQRGGSRKLDPHEGYSSTYSARWCLSINI